MFDALQLGIRRDIQTKLHMTLHLVQDFLELTSRRIARGDIVLSLDVAGTQVGPALSSLCVRSNLMMCYVARDDGAFYLISRMYPTVMVYTSPRPGVAREWLMEQADVTAYLHGNSSVLTSSILIPFDPRQRPWFLTAGAPGAMSWSDPYAFNRNQFGDACIGITATATVPSPAAGAAPGARTVVAVDFVTTAVTAMLLTLLPSPHSTAALILTHADGTVSVLASTNQAVCPAATLNGTSVVVAPVASCAFASAAIAAADGVARTASHLVIVSGARAVGGVVAPFLVAVQVPLADLVQPATLARDHSLMIVCSVGAAVALFGCSFLALAVLRPLGELSAAMQQVGHDLDVREIDPEGPRQCGAVWAAEVASLHAAFCALARQLRTVRKFVPESLFTPASHPAGPPAPTPRALSDPPPIPSAVVIRGAVSAPARAPIHVSFHHVFDGAPPPHLVGGHSGHSADDEPDPRTQAWHLVRELGSGAAAGGLAEAMSGRVQASRRSTALCVRLVLDRLAIREPLAREVVDCVVAAVREGRGVVEAIVGDDIVATFGLHSPLAHHASAAAACAFEIRRLLPRGTSVAMAAATSWLVAHFFSLLPAGAASMTISASGPAIQIARALVAVAGPEQVLLHASTCAEAEGAKLSALLPDVMALTAVAGDGSRGEWMYELATVEEWEASDSGDDAELSEDGRILQERIRVATIRC